MNPALRFVVPLACLAGLTAKVGGDPAPVPQPQVEFAKGLQGTFNADWQGAGDRTYFTQFSLDLGTWHYAPFIDFGGGDHRRGIESHAKKFLMRLVCVDFPGVTSLEEAMNAHFDSDGLSNVFEVMNGFDPLTANANDDAEEDGLLLTNEQLYGRSPHVRDHPAVKLSVVIGN